VLPNVVLAPHIASATTRTRSEMSAMASRNMATAVRGGRPPNLVNPEVKR
jgi:lactate dehydrogenase-like 2-hydroxyacid dehydrogenase